MRLVDGSEIVPGWKISLVLRNGTTGYWISLEDMIGSNGLFTTDDRGVINTPGNAGYQLPAGVEPSRFAKAGAMLRTVAFFQEEGGDCCSDHMCCCACTCSQTFTNGAKNCGCVACTWCPACT